MIRQTNLIRIDVTPKMLREIADILEAKWKRAVLGEVVPRYELEDHTHKLEVWFVVDQEAMHNEERIKK